MTKVSETESQRHFQIHSRFIILGLLETNLSLLDTGSARRGAR